VISITNQQLIYPVALILSTTRKTCEAMASLAGKSGDTFCRLLKEKSVTPHDLVNIAKNILIGSSYYLILDDTIIEKTYAKWIEGACDNFDTSNGQIVRSLCSVVAMISDGKRAIPIDQDLSISHDLVQNKYKTKVQIALELISRVKKLVCIKMVIADGLYATEQMISTLIKEKFYFEMSFHANRIVEYNGEKIGIKQIKDLELKGKKFARTKRVKWKNIDFYVTSVKRTTKTGRNIVVYQASNFKAFAKKHVQTYGFRWNIEKFFRTGKQYLGLTHCQLRSKNAQENHIFNVFFAYALLQFETKKFGLKNPESAAKQLKRRKYPFLISYFMRSTRIFKGFYA
jgi:SRSO17 transposase